MEAKQFPDCNIDGTKFIDRGIAANLGLRNEEITITNGNIKYNKEDKTWECQICHKKSKMQSKTNDQSRKH